jgi:hypothetical protein
LSIYENTPAYCERAAHIAEKAMPICKGMAKLYLMFHEKTTTVFERRKNIMKKILAFILVFATVAAFAATASAYQYEWTTWRTVTGGASQKIVSSQAREQPERIDLYITALDLNGQSKFRIRGYVGSSSVTCTELSSSITGTGSNLARYTQSSVGDLISVKASIESKSKSDKMYFKGRINV